MARSRGDNSDVREDIDVSDEISDDMTLLQDVPLEELTLEEDDDETPDPRTRRRRLRWYVAGGLAGAAVVAAALAGPSVWGLLSQRHATLATPDQLAGLTLDRSSDGRATADYLRTAVAAKVSLNSSVGAIYDDPANKQRSVMLFGGTGLLLAPDKDLAAVFQLLDDQDGGMKGIRSVPPGPLGGEMKCGTSTGDGEDMSVCGWADHGSIVLALFPGRSPDDSATLLQQMRNGIQARH